MGEEEEEEEAEEDKEQETETQRLMAKKCDQFFPLFYFSFNK